MNSGGLVYMCVNDKPFKFNVDIISVMLSEAENVGGEEVWKSDHIVKT